VGAPEIGNRRLRLHGRNEASEQIVIGVAGQMLAAGLVHSDSAFILGRRIWTSRNAAELVGALDRVLATGSSGRQAHLLRRSAAPATTSTATCWPSGTIVSRRSGPARSPSTAMT
jgi:hypothetical protein